MSRLLYNQSTFATVFSQQVCALGEGFAHRDASRRNAWGEITSERLRSPDGCGMSLNQFRHIRGLTKNGEELPQRPERHPSTCRPGEPGAAPPRTRFTRLSVLEVKTTSLKSSRMPLASPWRSQLRSAHHQDHEGERGNPSVEGCRKP